MALNILGASREGGTLCRWKWRWMFATALSRGVLLGGDGAAGVTRQPA
jgi:hypothetical protein